MVGVKLILSSTNINIIGKMLLELLKSGSKGINVTILCTMIDYIFKVMRDEYDTLNFSPMRHN